MLLNISHKSTTDKGQGRVLFELHNLQKLNWEFQWSG